VRKLMGWVLVGMAVHFLRPVLAESAAVFLLSAVALAAGVHLGWLDQNTATFRAFAWLKTGAGVAGLVLAAFLVTAWALKGPGWPGSLFRRGSGRGPEAQKAGRH